MTGARTAPGHLLGIGELEDMRRWMNPALSGQGNPNAFSHTD